MLVAALTPTPAAIAARAEQRQCSKLFTVKMAERAARVVYDGGKPTRRQRRHLRYYDRCQRNPDARKYVRGYYRRRARLAESPTSHAVASWYYDAGSTASGFHAYYGIANKALPFGTHVEICYRGCVDTTVDDRGPYVGGRTFDLNQNTAGAIGFSGVQEVAYRIR